MKKLLPLFVSAWMFNGSEKFFQKNYCIVRFCNTFVTRPVL